MDTRKYSRLTPGVLPADTTAPALHDLAQLARIIEADATGARFELLDAPGYSYGPAPWGLGSYATVAASISGGGYPHVGDTALVVFAGLGTGHPIVVSWWRA